ncbi:MAG: class I mannose-6-phosphate isomerase [Rariglobus sp.]
MSDLRGKLLLLPQNRVWRTYTGGRTLETLAGVAAPADSHLAEDWIGSVTESRIPGRDQPGEGISTVLMGGRTHNLRALIEADPVYHLGAAHVTAFGSHPMLLVKFLDSAIRLHFQCHPSRTFARARLGSNSGKTEAYHILGVRPGVTQPYFYMGFQHPPEPAELKRMILEQDIAAMERCFEKMPARPGDTFLIPGGFPHALGEGVFMVEIQEPTDFAVRYEFDRGGYVLPEAARFMGRDVDFALEMIDATKRPIAEIERDYRCRPTREAELGPGSYTDSLIGPEKTPCFRVKKTTLASPVVRPSSGGFHIGIVTAGACDVSVGGETLRLNRYDKYFLPAGLGAARFTPLGGTAEILECHPPAP